jgi:hypothetical protein
MTFALTVPSFFFNPGPKINRAAAPAIATMPMIKTTSAADVDIFPVSFLSIALYLSCLMHSVQPIKA